MSKSNYVSFEWSKLVESSNEMIISNGLLNGDDITIFNITNNGNLKRIVIGDNCFGTMRVFELDGLSELESVVIGQKSFTYAKDINAIKKSRRTDGDLRIANCPKLKTLQIGDWSFSDYHSFELNNLPSLQSIEMSNYCFYYALSLSLTSMTDGRAYIQRLSSTAVSETRRICFL